MNFVRVLKGLFVSVFLMKLLWEVEAREPTYSTSGLFSNAQITGNPAYLKPNRSLLKILCRTYRGVYLRRQKTGGRVAIDAETRQKHVETCKLQKSMHFPLYKGAIEENRKPVQTVRTIGVFLVRF